MPRRLSTLPPYLFEDTLDPQARQHGAPFGPEVELWKDGVTVIGIDEAGRGPLAGPVVAAAACFAPGVRLAGVGDSKTITETKREELFGQIQDLALAWAIVAVEPSRIDEINILGATTEAMKLAAADVATQLSSTWPTLLVDGRIPTLGLGKQLNIIRGDAKSFSIGAASILAKVHRDRLMIQMETRYPGYGFQRHKGYPTALHRRSLLEQGRCPIHRLSFTIAGQNGDRIAIGELPEASPLLHDEAVR